MKLNFPREVCIKKTAEKKENGEGVQVRQTKLYISRVNTSLLPSKPQALSCRAMSPIHTGMSSQIGPASAWLQRGAPRKAQGGGMYPALEEELPVLTFTRFTGAIEFVSEM